MDSTRKELQKALGLIGQRGRGKPYPKELLERLVSYAIARRQQGAQLVTIGEELGMSWRTLARWVTERAAAPKFRRVQVVSALPRSEVVVHGPRGLRIEGLGIDGVAELVRRLGE